MVSRYATRTTDADDNRLNCTKSLLYCVIGLVAEHGTATLGNVVPATPASPQGSSRRADQGRRRDAPLAGGVIDSYDHRRATVRHGRCYDHAWLGRGQLAPDVERELAYPVR